VNTSQTVATTGRPWLKANTFALYRAQIDALHLQNNFAFVAEFARRLNAESGCKLHPIASEVLAGPSPFRTYTIAKASESLTPAGVSPDDYACYFNKIERRLSCPIF